MQTLKLWALQSSDGQYYVGSAPHGFSPDAEKAQVWTCRYWAETASQALAREGFNLIPVPINR